MTDLLIPTEAGFTHDIAPLVKLIQQGDGMGWPGDPRMYVRIGILEVKNTVTGQVVATGRAYEVYRLNEDGSDTFVARWKLEEKDKIVFDLARMRPESPGFVSAGEQARKHNEAIQAQADSEFRDSMGEAKSHLADIIGERTWGKRTFRQMPGRRDEIAAGAEPAVSDAGE